MALTLKTIKEPGVQKFLTITEATFGSSYTSEGETFTAANAGLSQIDHAWCQIVHGDEAKTSEQFVSEVYYEGGKLHALNGKTGKEVEAGKNMEKLKVLVFAIGKGRAR